ncbi:tetratricopeptide repeat protein, partial [Staphylococcus aureus]
GRLADAEDLALQTLDVRRTKLGATHRDTLTSMSILANVRKDQGRLDDTVALLSECAELRGSRLGPEHWDTISAELQLES